MNKKKSNKQSIIKWFFVVLVVFLSLSLPAKAGGEPDGVGGDPLQADAPIDGGLSLLLAAGAAYGIKKYRNGRKKDTE